MTRGVCRTLMTRLVGKVVEGCEGEDDPSYVHFVLIVLRCQLELETNTELESFALNLALPVSATGSPW